MCLTEKTEKLDTVPRGVEKAKETDQNVPKNTKEFRTMLKKTRDAKKDTV